jgi:hypothetical protein
MVISLEEAFSTARIDPKAWSLCQRNAFSRRLSFVVGASEPISPLRSSSGITPMWVISEALLKDLIGADFKPVQVDLSRLESGTRGLIHPRVSFSGLHTWTKRPRGL